MMATHGVEVVGTDYNEELVATLNAGHTTFKEEGLDELFADALKSGIKFTTEYQVCDTYIVSVPTPYDKLDKKIDPCYVIAACKTVLEVAPKGAVLVIESTISPNTVGSPFCAPAAPLRPSAEDVNARARPGAHHPRKHGLPSCCTTTVRLARTTPRWARRLLRFTQPSVRAKSV